MARTSNDGPRDPHVAPVPPGRDTRVYDWPAIKKLYVEGMKDEATGIIEWPSLDAVAKQHNVHPQRVRFISARDGWVAERDLWRRTVEEQRRKARANALAATATKVEGKATQTAVLGLELVQVRLTEIARLQQARQQLNQADQFASSPAIEALEMTRLGQAADLFHKIALRALGLGDNEVRLELSGPGGGPIEISQELARDDPTRVSNVLGVLARAGVGGILGDLAAAARDRDDVVDAELVDDEPGGPAGGDGDGDGGRAALSARS